jgi:peptidyl-prolyl cis-trans isomerase C
MTIDGEEVTRVEVLNNFMQSGSQLPQGTNLNQIFPLIQEQYVMGEILVEAAKDAGIDQNHPDVQDRLRQARDQAVRAVFLQEIGEAEVTEEDIRNAYEDIVANAPDVTERKIRHILLETQAAANALIIRLQQGADFANLAEANSTGPTAQNGGDLGFIARDQVVPEFAEAAFSLDVGDFTTEPVETQFGWHIIKVEEERVRPKPTFEQARDEIANQIRQAATQEKVQELRQNADVVLFDVNGNTVGEEAVEGNEPEAQTEAETPVTNETQEEETAE